MRLTTHDKLTILAGSIFALSALGVIFGSGEGAAFWMILSGVCFLALLASRPKQ